MDNRYVCLTLTFVLYILGKRRRIEGGFNGSEKILNHLNNGVDVRRVGFIVEGAPARGTLQL